MRRFKSLAADRFHGVLNNGYGKAGLSRIQCCPTHAKIGGQSANYNVADATLDKPPGKSRFGSAIGLNKSRVAVALGIHAFMQHERRFFGFERSRKGRSERSPGANRR